MRIAQAALIAALVAATVASAAAGPAIRPGPIVFPHGLGERPAFWRGGEGDHDLWRHRQRDFIGPVGPIVGEAAEPGPGAAPSPFFVSTPVTVNVTLAPAGGPPPGWSDGPKLIEIGRSAPPPRRLPLVVYGD
jgi:hypothetical protein